MRTIGWNILTFAFALTSAQGPKECSFPLEYPNTRLTSRSSSRTKFSSGDKVYYNCADGFNPYTGSRAVECKGGTWTRLTLKCEKKSCGYAGDLLHGQLNYEGNSYIGDKVYATCNEGYTLKGPNYLICQASGWVGEFPTCEEIGTTCSTPAVTNSVQRAGGISEYRVGETASFTCQQGFRLDGAQEITCVSNGQWQPQPPKCLPSPEKTPSARSEKKSCGYAGDLLHGQLNYEGNSYIGDKVYATCNEGYTLKGPNYLICQASGWVGEFPTCEEIETTCSTPAVTNSVQRAGGISEYRVGETASFTCQQGFRLDGAQQITCGSDGQWQPQPPKCLPSPEKTPSAGSGTGRCGVPLNVQNSNANLADKYMTKTSFASGEKVYYVCDVGYTPVGGSRARMCKNGKWTPLRLRCERKYCGSAGEIINGRYDYSGVQFGDTATAVCNEGHILVGQAKRNCMSNGWDGRIPDCEAVDCEDPPVVENAERRGVQEPPYSYLTVVSYKCRVGTLDGQKDVWCTKNGTWSTPPRCTKITCSPPNVANAFWMKSYNRFFQHEDSISIDCRPGYTMSGPNYITCSHGQWMPRLPECRHRSRPYFRRG